MATRALFSLLTGLLPFLGGGIVGWLVRDWKADADSLEDMRDAHTALNKAVAAVNRPAEKLETVITQIRPLETQTRNTIREVYRNVEVPADCAVPAAGVRVLDAIRVNANAAAAGEPIDTVQPTFEATPTAD